MATAPVEPPSHRRCSSPVHITRYPHHTLYTSHVIYITRYTHYTLYTSHVIHITHYIHHALYTSHIIHIAHYTHQTLYTSHVIHITRYTHHMLYTSHVIHITHYPHHTLSTLQTLLHITKGQPCTVADVQSLCPCVALALALLFSFQQSLGGVPLSSLCPTPKFLSLLPFKSQRKST